MTATLLTRLRFERWDEECIVPPLAYVDPKRFRAAMNPTVCRVCVGEPFGRWRVGACEVETVCSCCRGTGDAA